MKLTSISAPLHLYGEGFPEGKVAAPVGSIYVDTLATAGAIRWIKTAYTGTVGWKIEYGDTGWIDVRHTLLNGWTVSGAEIRRINDQVFVKIFKLDGSNATGSAFLPMPEGFNWGGVGNQIVIGEIATRYDPVNRAFALSPGSDYFGSHYHEGNLTINRAWPSTLP